MKVKPAVSASGKAPPALLISLVDTFLSRNGLESTHSTFTKELKSRRKNHGWDKVPRSEALEDVTLESLLKVWSREQKNRNQDSDDTTSDEEDTDSDQTTSGSDDESDTEVLKKQLQSSSDTSSYTSPSSSDSDSEEEVPKYNGVKKGKRRSKAHSSTSSSSSESDADDEGDTVTNTNVSKVSKGLSNKRRDSPAQTTTTKTVGESPRKRKASSLVAATEDATSAPQSTTQSTKRIKRPIVPSRSLDTDSISDTSDSDASSTSSTSSSSDSDSELSSLAKSETTTSEDSAASTGSSTESETSSDEDSVTPNPQANAANITANVGSTADSESSVTVVDDKQTLPGLRLKADPSMTAPGVIQDQSDFQSPSRPANLKRHLGTRPTPLAELSGKSSADSHISNAYQSYEYADRAYNALSVTRGKNFTKEKNKKKRGSYRGGAIDTSGGKGFKFDD